MCGLPEEEDRPRSGYTEKLTREEAEGCLEQAPGWSLREDGLEIHRTFSFSDYSETVAFVNAVARIAEQEDHHPEITFGYRSCRIVYSTHSAGGLTGKDFRCAELIHALL